MGGSVCVARGSQLLAFNVGEPRISHSNTLLSDINRALAESAATVADIDLFAAASGPGSFTGLRIGIATIKALATTLERPCVGVPSLEAVAHAGGTSELTVALLPAGRGEVFAQMFSVSAQGEVKQLHKAAHIPPAEMLQVYGGLPNILWCGEGAHLYEAAIKSQAELRGHQIREIALGVNCADEGWRLAPRSVNLAQHVSALALRRFEHDELDDPKTLSAIYVRPSDAELNKQCPPPN